MNVLISTQVFKTLKPLKPIRQEFPACLPAYSILPMYYNQYYYIIY